MVNVIERAQILLNNTTASTLPAVPVWEGLTAFPANLPQD